MDKPEENKEELSPSELRYNKAMAMLKERGVEVSAACYGDGYISIVIDGVTIYDGFITESL